MFILSFLVLLTCDRLSLLWYIYQIVWLAPVRIVWILKTNQNVIGVITNWVANTWTCPALQTARSSLPITRLSVHVSFITFQIYLFCSFVQVSNDFFSCIYRWRSWFFVPPTNDTLVGGTQIQLLGNFYFSFLPTISMISCRFTLGVDSVPTSDYNDTQVMCSSSSPSQIAGESEVFIEVNNILSIRTV